MKRPNFLLVRDEECCPDDLLRAVIMVQTELKFPGSDRWHQISSYRESLWKRVRRKWCQNKNKSVEKFPFSEDYVVHHYYTAYRKTNRTTDNELTSYLGLPRNVDKEENARNRAERRAALE